MASVVASLNQLVDYVNLIVDNVDADKIANESSTQFNKDPDRKEAFGKVINSSILEVSNSIPLADKSGVRQVYTTYYLNEMAGGFKLVRHTTPGKSLTTKYIEDEREVRNKISAAWKSVVTQEAAIFQYERLFQELFTRIIKDFQNLGGNTVGLLDRALIRKCKFVRVEKGTLSVGYSPLDKKYIVRYNPKFCIDATVEYFVNPVLDNKGNYKTAQVTEYNVLYPIMFFLSHEFAHVLYRHVSESDTSLQADLPHYVKQYFGDAYINNSIPYLLGDDDSQRTNSGDQSSLSKAKAHHPIGINEQVPLDNYLKQSYIVEIYKSLISQDAHLIDTSVLDTLKRYMDLDNSLEVKSSITDDLGYASVDEVTQLLDSMPSDVKKKVFRSHVKFFTGNFYDIMSRIFPQGYSSNSYMRVLKSLLESLFEDIKETETATQKQTPPPPPEPSQDAPESGAEGENEEPDTGEGGAEGAESPPDQGDDPDEDNKDGSGDDENGDGGSASDEDNAAGESEGSEQGEAGGDSEGTDDGGEQSSDSSGISNSEPKYKVGDLVKQVSTGKIGKITSIEADGTYVIDTSQVTSESVLSFALSLSRLIESIIRVGEEDLVSYEASENQDGESDQSENPDANPDGGEEPESTDGEEGQGDPEEGQPDPNGSEGGDRDTSDAVPDQSGDAAPGEQDNPDDGPQSSTGAPTLDQDAMNDDGKGDPGDGEGDASPQSDLPSLPPEDGPPGQSSDSGDQGETPQGETPGSENNMEGGGEGGAGDPEASGELRDDSFDDLAKQLDEAHEDSKTGMSDSTSEYLEEDEVTREEADQEIDNEDAKKDLSSEIENTIEEARKEGKDIDEILKGVDKDEINSTFDIDINKRPRQVSKAAWKKLFRQLISLASGFDIQRDNARPSRKVEGLWGANKKVPAIKDVAILLDCSASMSSPMFKAIFAELQELGKLPELKDTWVHLIPWGSSAEYKRFRGMSPPVVKQMYAYGKVGLGGTYIGFGYEMMMKKVRNPDLVIILTDSEYSDYSGWQRTGLLGSSWSSRNSDFDAEKIKSYMKRVARKTVIVSISPSSSYMNEMIMSDYKKRLIDLNPSEAKESADFD